METGDNHDCATEISCPADLYEKAVELGVLKDAAERYEADIWAIESVARDFVDYWLARPGAKKSRWMNRLREWLARKHAACELIDAGAPPGAVAALFYKEEDKKIPKKDERRPEHIGRQIPGVEETKKLIAQMERDYGPIGPRELTIAEWNAQRAPLPPKAEPEAVKAERDARRKAAEDWFYADLAAERAKRQGMQ